MQGILHKEEINTINNINLENHKMCNVINLRINQLESQLKLIPDDGVILVPGYEEPNGELSLQLAVTGKYKYDESLSEGIAREVAEELGFSLDLSKIRCKKLFNKKDIYFSAINMTESLSNKVFESTNTNKDNFRKRMTCWVYFQEKDYPIVNEDNFNIITNRKRIKSDDIAGKVIFGIPKKHMKKILEAWKKDDIDKHSKYLFSMKKLKYNVFLDF